MKNKNISNYRKALKTYQENREWFILGLESISWSIVGNLLPIYVMLFIAIADKGFKWDAIYDAIHQPFTYLILSGTYLTSAYFINSKRADKAKSKMFQVNFAILLILIGILITDKSALEQKTAPLAKKIISLSIFIISFLSYLYFEFRRQYLKQKIEREPSSAEKLDFGYKEMLEDDEWDFLNDETEDADE